MTNSTPNAKITFLYSHEGTYNTIPSFPATAINYAFDADVTIEEACQAFENFLLSCGFRLNSNETIGIIEQ